MSENKVFYMSFVANLNERVTHVTLYRLKLTLARECDGVPRTRYALIM